MKLQKIASKCHISSLQIRAEHPGLWELNWKQTQLNQDPSLWLGFPEGDPSVSEKKQENKNVLRSSRICLRICLHPDYDGVNGKFTCCYHSIENDTLNKSTAPPLLADWFDGKSVQFVAANTGIWGQNLIFFKHLPSAFCAGTKPDPNHSIVKIEPKEKHKDAA